MIKKMLGAMATLALLNFIGLAVVAGMGWKKGWLEPERVRKAVSILRGEEAEKSPKSEIPSPSEGVAKAKGAPETIQHTSDLIREGRDSEERLRVEFARREREIQDGFRLWEGRQLALLREKEALEEDKKRFAEQREQIAKSAGDSGVGKEIDTLAGIPAKAAKSLLMAKPEAEAVRILKTMDQRKLNKIVKECKSEEERQWIGRILDKFHTSTAKAEPLDAG